MEHFHASYAASGDIKTLIQEYLHPIEFGVLLVAFLYHVIRYRKQMF